jgi:hypothetical protein
MFRRSLCSVACRVPAAPRHAVNTRATTVKSTADYVVLHMPGEEPGKLDRIIFAIGSVRELGSDVFIKHAGNWTTLTNQSPTSCLSARSNNVRTSTHRAQELLKKHLSAHEGTTVVIAANTEDMKTGPIRVAVKNMCTLERCGVRGLGTDLVRGEEWVEHPLLGRMFHLMFGASQRMPHYLTACPLQQPVNYILLTNNRHASSVLGGPHVAGMVGISLILSWSRGLGVRFCRAAASHNNAAAAFVHLMRKDSFEYAVLASVDSRAAMQSPVSALSHLLGALVEGQDTGTWDAMLCVDETELVLHTSLGCIMHARLVYQ